MALPAFLLAAFFTVYPFAQAVYLSFIKYVVTSPSDIGRFVGMRNYEAVIWSYYFPEAVTNTIIFTVISVTLILTAAIGVSLALNVNLKGVGIVRFLILIPWAIPPTAAGLMWRFVWDSYGWFNKLGYLFFGMPQVYLMGRERWIQTILIMISQLWQQLPFCVILITAALLLIPKEVIDSALVDGAGAWQRFRYVTFPFMRTVIALVAAYQALLAITVYDVVYVFTGGTWGMISYYAFAETFQWTNFGRGAAVSMVIAITTLLVIVIILRVLPVEKMYKYTFVGE